MAHTTIISKAIEKAIIKNAMLQGESDFTDIDKAIIEYLYSLGIEVAAKRYPREAETYMFIGSSRHGLRINDDGYSLFHSSSTADHEWSPNCPIADPQMLDKIAGYFKKE